MLKMLNHKGVKRTALALVFAGVALAVELVLSKTVLSPRDVHPIFLSFAANALLWIMIVHAIRRDAAIRFAKWQIAAVAAGCVLLVGYYAYLLKTRDFIYYWDYGVYYGNQLAFRGPFRGLGRGLRNWVGTFTGDYPQFLSVFFELPFRFSDRTANGFVLACCVVIFPPLLTCLAALIQKIGMIARLKRPGLFWSLAFPTALSMPVLHWSFAHGQPDLFGLVFALLIMLVTLEYRFEKIEPGRWLVLFASIIALSLSRRWYMYWLVGYVAVYALGWGIWFARKAVRKEPVLSFFRNACLFVIPALVVIFVSLRPMIEHILSYDYGRYYAFYSGGGMLYELKAQLGRIGWLPALLMGVGFVWGLCQKHTRGLAISTMVGFGAAVYLFVSVQNTGWHQNLLALPFLWIALLLGCAAISAVRAPLARSVCTIAAIGLIVCQTACGFAPVNGRGGWLSSGNLWQGERTDRQAVEEVSLWLAENCQGDERAYMIPHGNPYNPDVFRSVLRPDDRVYQLLAYGSAVPGTHAFPTGLFDAKYVLTCDPFCEYGLAGKYNDTFLADLERGRFAVEKTFDMGNGYVMTVYRRTVPVDLAEIEYYREAFREENEAFPENFDHVFDSYISRMCN